MFPRVWKLEHIYALTNDTCEQKGQMCSSRDVSMYFAKNGDAALCGGFLNTFYLCSMDRLNASARNYHLLHLYHAFYTMHGCSLWDILFRLRPLNFLSCLNQDSCTAMCSRPTDLIFKLLPHLFWANCTCVLMHFMFQISSAIV